VTAVVHTQILSYINLLEEPFGSVYELRSHPAPSPPYMQSQSAASREGDIEQLMTPENVCKWNFDLFQLRAVAGMFFFEIEGPLSSGPTSRAILCAGCKRWCCCASSVACALLPPPRHARGRCFLCEIQSDKTNHLTTAGPHHVPLQVSMC